jgi:hypothetical protein
VCSGYFVCGSAPLTPPFVQLEASRDDFPMEDYLAILTDNERMVFSAIADFAFSLGYRAKKDKSNAIGYSFTHSRVKKQILRFTSAKGQPILRIKFFASKDYSDFFHQTIRATIEEYDYKYTGCYGCEECDGTHGYRYKYPDGREYYRCGKELIEILDVHDLPLKELFDLIKKQHEFFLVNLPGK